MGYLKLIMLMLFVYTLLDRICNCVEKVAEYELEIYKLEEKVNGTEVTNG